MMKPIKLIGVCISLIYLSSIIILINSYEYVYDELGSISISALNLVGFEGRWQFNITNYFPVGLLIVVFSLLFKKEIKGLSKVGEYGTYFLLLSGLFWMSFGIFPLTADGDNSIFGLSHISRITLCWLSGIIGFILLSIEYDKVFRNKKFKWVILGVAIVMLAESFYFSIGEYLATLSLITWTIYMLFYSVLALAIQPIDKT